MPYKELPHTADIRIKVYAESLSQLFSEGILALYDIIFGQIPTCKGIRKDSFSISAYDMDILFHDLLDEVLYLTIVKKRKICQFQLKIDEKIDEQNKTITVNYSYRRIKEGEIKKEVKAITYHNLHIRKKGNFYETEVIMDV